MANASSQLEFTEIRKHSKERQDARKRIEKTKTTTATAATTTTTTTSQLSS